MSQIPNDPSSVFVTTADLSEQRDPPKDGSIIDLLVGNRYGRAALLAVYLIFMYFAWNTIDDFQFSNEILAIIFGLVGSLPFFLTILGQALVKQRETGIPFNRNEHFLAGAAQTIFLVFVIGLTFYLIQNLQDNLAKSNIRINFNVLGRAFGTNVSEGPADPGGDWAFLTGIPLIGEPLYNWSLLRPDTVTRALLAGLVNTLRVVSVSLVFSTILGVLLGIGLLMNNWLLQKVSTVFVEVFRNTPLLLQLFFIYRAVLGALPSRPTDAVELPGNIFVSGRGIAYPALVATETTSIYLICLILGILVGIGLWRWRLQVNEQTGAAANTLRYFSLSVLAGIVIGLGLSFAFGGTPYTIEVPVAGNFNFVGGATFSAEYLALALGLILYTSAFIADIVRAGIQSVPKGQLEAAGALGLTSGQTLRMIVLPQALRLIIPPLTNQYLNLSKNSSLAIAIGFFDLYNVANVAANQTGQAVAFFVVLMVTYLILSLIISLFMNIFNQSQTLKTR